MQGALADRDPNYVFHLEAIKIQVVVYKGVDTV